MIRNRHFLPALLFAISGLLTACASANEYTVDMLAKLQPAQGKATITLVVDQNEHLLRKLRLKAPTTLFKAFKASAGEIQRQADELIWTVPARGGRLSYTAEMNVPKGSGFDARSTDTWALLRFEDLLPPVRSTTRKGSSSSFKLSLQGPDNWSFETRYGRWRGEPFTIKTEGKNFDRPTGWLLAGTLGVRRETIEGADVVVAAPAGSRFPRIPTLAFLRWTLAEFAQVFPNLPERILIVSGDDAMWRGALSGPESLFLHRDRPLISENGTSPLLHELVHVVTRMSAADGDDWIVEGLAEYYGLEILRRSNGLSQARFDAALVDMQKWVKSDQGKLADPSKGADTAAAVLLFAQLAEELDSQPISKNSTRPSGYGLDTVVADLLHSDKGRTRVSRAALRTSVEAVLGRPSTTLRDAELP